FFSFIQQGFQLDRLAFASLDRFAVFAQDRAEPDMLQGYGVAPAPSRSEELFKVELLATVGDINDAVRVKRLCPILHRRQVSCGVEKCTILFLNKKRRACQFGIIIKKDTERAFAQSC